MKGWKAAGLLLDLALLASGLVTGGPIGEGIRVVVVLVLVVVGGAVAFLICCLAVAVIQQRQPPYQL